MSTRRILIHIFFSLSALCSLYLFLAPPLWTSSTKEGTQALLLCEDPLPTQIPALYARLPRFTLSKKVAQQHPQAAYYPDIASLQAARPDIHTWILVGYGLPAKLLAEADSSFQIDIRLLQKPTGLVAAAWPLVQKPQTQAMLSLQSRSTSSSQAVLLQATGRVDSLHLPEGDSLLRIPLATLPLLGRGSAILRYEGDSLLVPLQRENSTKVRTLIWESSPSTELRFLKNWLQEEGYPGAIRTGISRFQTQQERFNMPQRLALEVLSKQLLESFDVVIMDEEALLALSAAEQNLLLGYIRQKGLGLLLWVTAPFQLPAWRGALPSLRALPDSEKKVIPKGASQGLPEEIALAAAPVLVEGFRHALWKDSQGQVLCAWQSYGQGRIGVQIIQNTFQYRLRQQNEAYQHFWANLLETLSPPVMRYWQASFPLIPRTKQAFPIKIQAAQKPTYLLVKPEASTTSDTLYLESTRGLFEWQGFYRAAQAGWHEAGIPQDTSKYYFYVFEENAWPAYQAQETFISTQDYAAQQPSLVGKELYSKQILSPIYAFIIFLFSMAVLWVVPKWPKSSK